MRDLRPLTHSSVPTKPSSAGPHRLGGLGRSSRPASADPDAHSIAVLKSDILALQNRIDLLGAGPGKSATTFATFGMQQQERFLFTVSNAGTGDNLPVTKMRLLEQLVAKIGELCTVLGRLGARTGLLAEEDTPPTPPSAGERPAAGATVRSDAGAASGSGPLQFLTLPQRPPRVSLLEAFLAFADDWAALCVADFDPREVVTQVSMEGDRQRELQAVHAHFQGLIHSLQQEHAATVAELTATHETERAKLQTELDELHAAHSGKKGGPDAKALKDLNREFALAMEENARLKQTVDLLQQMVQVPDEAHRRAFGSGADLTWLQTTLGLAIPQPDAGAEASAQADVKVEEKHPKHRKPLDEQEVKLIKATQKLHVYTSTLERQNDVLNQVEDRLRQLLADHAAALTAEQERGRLLEARLAAALTDREDSVARLQKTLLNHQAETVCLRAELRERQSEQEAGQRLLQADIDAKAGQPRVPHADFPPPLTLPQRLKGQNATLARLEQRLAVSEAEAAAAQQQLREWEGRAEAWRRERRELQTAAELARQQTARHLWAVEQKDVEVQGLQTELAVLRNRLATATDSNSVAFERTKDLQSELRKKDAMIEAVKADAAARITAAEEAMATQQAEVEAARREFVTAQEELQTTLDLRQQALDFAEERVVALQTQLAELRSLLELRLEQALEALDAGTALLGFQPALSDAICPISQASNIGKRLDAIGETLIRLQDELDARWHTPLTLLQREQQRLRARVAEMIR